MHGGLEESNRRTWGRTCQERDTDIAKAQTSVGQKSFGAASGLDKGLKGE